MKPRRPPLTFRSKEVPERRNSRARGSVGAMRVLGAIVSIVLRLLAKAVRRPVDLTGDTRRRRAEPRHCRQRAFSAIARAGGAICRQSDFATLERRKPPRPRCLRSAQICVYRSGTSDGGRADDPTARVGTSQRSDRRTDQLLHSTAVTGYRCAARSLGVRLRADQAVRYSRRADQRRDWQIRERP